MRRRVVRSLLCIAKKEVIVANFVQFFYFRYVSLRFCIKLFYWNAKRTPSSNHSLSQFRGYRAQWWYDAYKHKETSQNKKKSAIAKLSNRSVVLWQREEKNSHSSWLVSGEPRYCALNNAQNVVFFIRKKRTKNIEDGRKKGLRENTAK